ncbi:hypothetical protein GCM10010329_85580 [Streptomyces spiroverticillatus]|nr:hypothetical protein GCM10010329_85580 [Streptomyces spiroverticillatus]
MAAQMADGALAAERVGCGHCDGDASRLGGGGTRAREPSAGDVGPVGTVTHGFVPLMGPGRWFGVGRILRQASVTCRHPYERGQVLIAFDLLEQHGNPL